MDTYNWFVNAYTHLWALRDRRLDGWLMMDSIKPPLCLLIIYIIMVVYGQTDMRHHKSLNLRPIVLIYNIFIAILNLHIFKEVAIVSYRQGFNWWCEPVRESTDPQEMRMLAALHLYTISKGLEFLDTAFIIIRKKPNQLTFLHVYHHSSMLALSWVICRWFPGGNVAVLATLLNSLVHVVMYSYYGLSALGPQVTKYLWWKRYLTILQLIQFTIGLTVGIHMFVFGCDYTKWLQYMTIVMSIFYLYLFGRFYFSAYASQRSKHISGDNVGKNHLVPLISTEVRFRKVISSLATPSTG